MAVIPDQNVGQQFREDENVVASDENMLKDQILETHNSDSRLYAVKPVLQIIEVIFHRASIDVPGSNTQDEKALLTDLEEKLELPTGVIGAIFYEIFCKSLNTGDIHNTTMDILRVVRDYNWDAKAALAVAAFAVSYGEFLHVVNFHATDPLAKAVALLKQLPENLKLSSENLKPKLDTVFNLVRDMMDVTKLIVEFYEIQRQSYFSPESPATVGFLILIPFAVYYVVRSTVISTWQILGFTGMGHKYISEDDKSSLANKLRTIHSDLSEQLKLYMIEKKTKDDESFKPMSIILESSHLDNYKPLKALFHAKDDTNFSPESPETVGFFTAVYRVVRSTVISASRILGLMTGMGHEYISEAWKLSSLAHKLSTIPSHLLDQLNRCYRYIEKKKDKEAFKAISIILESSHLDNSKPLSTLFHAKDGQPALYDRHNKRRVGIEELRRKVVVLFITGIEIPTEDYTIINLMYQEKRENPSKNESQYELIWVPIEDYWTKKKLERFERLKQEMDWFSVYHPRVVSPVVAKYIKHPQKLKFSKKPIFVVLDIQGRVVHKNAMHMMCIWGSAAYPFSESNEKLLWERETWRMELLADAIDSRLTGWIQGGRYVCLFGGEDIEWIRKFTRAIKEVARESNIILELLYVGKRKPKERNVSEINAIIENEKLASATIEWSYIRYFWLRIESMSYSKGQFSAWNNELAKTDPIMLGIISLLSFGSGTQGWALISKGSQEMTNGNADHMFTAIDEHGRWIPRENQIGFVPALGEYLKDLHN